MSLTVVLVRHGEAKNKKLGQTDFERELTSWGKQALEDAFPKAMGLVEVTPASELWVSSAIRARQTAEIANKTLQIETCRELKYLYDQDDEALIKDLAATEADVVVVIGHIPFMEDVCAELCGQYVRFSTGAAVAITIDDKMRMRGRLQWFVQGPVA